MSLPNALLISRSDGIVTFTLNRPDQRNGLDSELVAEFTAALLDVRDSADDRAVVLTGAGVSFCSGVDLSSAMGVDELTFMSQVGALIRALHELPRPVIAKVRGPAVGLGCSLALACDFVLASNEASFQLAFARRGLALDGGSSWLLPRRVGIGCAKELAYFAEKVDAARAVQIGLADRVVADDELDELADGWAVRLAEGPSRALSLTKRALDAAYESSLTQSLEREAVGQSLQFHTKEFREGIRSFKERRRPDFRAREPQSAAETSGTGTQGR